MAKRIIADNLDILVVENEDYSYGLQRREKEGEDFGLWLVTVKVPMGKKNRPASCTFHVLAEDAEGAISQVNHDEFGDDTNEKTAKAVRLPLYIRGWGLHEF